MNTVRLEAFAPQHVAAAHALWLATPGVGLSEADAPDALARFLQRNPGLSWVAMHGTELVGTILVGHDGRRGLVHHLAVATRCRRQGLGQRLLQQGLQALAAQGIAKCHLLVFADNADGRAFWQAVGAQWRQTLVIYSLATPNGA
jgi:N-acetylglutamate synthase